MKWKECKSLICSDWKRITEDMTVSKFFFTTYQVNLLRLRYGFDWEPISGVNNLSYISLYIISQKSTINISNM